MSDTDSDEDRKIDAILERMTKVKSDKKKVPALKEAEPEVPAKKPKKKRGPASEKQKEALAKGRAKAQENKELLKLDKDINLVEKKKKLAKLKKIQEAKNYDPDLEQEGGAVKALQKELAEMKASMKAPPQTVVQVMPATPATPAKVVDPAKEAYERQLRRYVKF